MLFFLLSEISFFSTLLVAYVVFAGKDSVGPTPAQALSLPLAGASTICLLASSVTMALAERALAAGMMPRFRKLWSLTLLLGGMFLAGTALEWHGLITKHQLTMSRNLFGTTYYTVVGFHAFHVTCGLLVMAVMLRLVSRRSGDRRPVQGVQLVSWYWHFVDVVWIVVFSVIYLWQR
ncbi:cytochrome c oxidase subunit 3 [Planctomicrobium sp. SH664]|uniref:cytochrome c oxidase subunit 3 n=1 Tax=Planctomicrobium sp. SH664 TaxID=3448125 RepID=UPI003F5AED43